MLSILTQFLSNRSNYQTGVLSNSSKLLNVVSGVLQGSVFLCLLLFLLLSLELFNILENKLIGYADNCALIVVMKSNDG